MPFVKRSAATSQPAAGTEPKEDASAAIAALGSPDPEVRWRAARALGGRAEAVPPLAAALAAETVHRVREAIMTALMRVGDDASVLALLPYLRSQDAAQRAAAIETLQALPDTIGPFMAALLEDDDSDVRILATELARNMPGPKATAVLCALLEHEQHPNVCAAAVDVLAEVGTPAAVPVLQACAQRFAGTPFLPFAVSVALARISDARS